MKSRIASAARAAVAGAGTPCGVNVVSMGGVSVANLGAVSAVNPGALGERTTGKGSPEGAETARTEASAQVSAVRTTAGTVAKEIPTAGGIVAQTRVSAAARVSPAAKVGRAATSARANVSPVKETARDETETARDGTETARVEAAVRSRATVATKSEATVAAGPAAPDAVTGVGSRASSPRQSVSNTNCARFVRSTRILSSQMTSRRRICTPQPAIS